MVYCFQAGLVFSTVARRDQVLADIEAQVAGSERWGATVTAAYTTTEIQAPAGRPALAVETRFTAQASLNSLTTRLENFATGPRVPVAGSWYALHSCPHDEGGVCGGVTQRTW